MKNLWNHKEAQSFADDPLKLRVYTSRLLGRNPDLVLHGGGNTSVKTEITDIFNDTRKILYIKGSGIDLETIDSAGFAPIRLDVLQRMSQLDHLSDMDLVKIQRSAMIDPFAPAPSLEAVVHAIIPYKYVDHTHADAVVTLTDNPDGEKLVREIYDGRILIIPYSKAGFSLAQTIFEMTRNLDWQKIDGLILMNHGVFTFADDAQTSYERMIQIASRAEKYLDGKGAINVIAQASPEKNLHTLAEIRRRVSLTKGAAMLARLDSSSEACGFAGLPNVSSIAIRGAMTPDHVIRTKPTPVIFSDDIGSSISEYAASYSAYFDRNTDGSLTKLDSAPRWGIWPRHGTLAFGRTLKETDVVADIASHTIRAIQWGEAIGGWQPLAEKKIFDMEYWELQQAKLLKKKEYPLLQGKIALVTGAASGIGLACAQTLHDQGAVVIGLDINPEISKRFNQRDFTGAVCDINDASAVQNAIDDTVRLFGGLDILVSNAGLFSGSLKIEDMDTLTWNRSIEINLTSHQRLLQASIPYLRQGLEPAVVFIASKNVPAPGPGASAYSVAKAGMTQLARIAAMELGQDGIRVNIVHPNAVYDTALWTPEVLSKRANHYGLTVEQYKTNNFLKTEVTSADVAALVLAMTGPAFAKTTGAQVPIDGGNDRVI
ncbi:bifunctional aldolase/short-chain dehydrogenase [Desulfococcaceae bacterium HSG9]|nr:bifunctional aldolase/short-chain dehydrogenase [Desulfococcaceae bacterium HSG9]